MNDWIIFIPMYNSMPGKIRPSSTQVKVPSPYSRPIKKTIFVPASDKNFHLKHLQHCNSNILFNRTNIFRDKTSFRQFLTWLLPGLKKMLILIISNTEGVKVLVCPAIFLDIRWVSGTNLPMFTYGRCCCHFLWLMLLPLFLILAYVIAMFG